MTTKKLQGSCSFADRIESLYLDELGDDEKQKVQRHLQECPHCLKRLFHLKQAFWRIESDLNSGVSNQTLDLARDIRSSDTQIGLIVCEPESTEMQHVFKAKVWFTANGKKQAGLARFSEVDFTDLPVDSIAIRTMTDRKRNTLLLYLYSESRQSFEGWTLDIPGEHEAITFNPSGVSEIHAFDVEEFHDKRVFLRATSGKTQN